LIQGRAQLSIRQIRGAARAQDDHVHRRQFRKDIAEALACETFQAVPVDSPTSTPFCDGQAKPGVALPVSAGKRHDPMTAEAGGTFEDSLEGASITETTVGREGEVAGLARANLVSAAQGISRTRPFARRAAKTLRPLRVALRALKP
jgi:hypothetical protein